MIKIKQIQSLQTTLNNKAPNSNFVGDSGSGGTAGLVPAPSTGDAIKYLKGDGTWAILTAIIISATEPSPANDDDVWLNTNDFSLNVYYNDGSYTAWIETGVIGAPGANGENGIGVPTGGSINQFLRKNSSTDYDASWGNLDNVDSINSGPISGLRNKFINGDFSVNQKEVISATSSSIYIADRWISNIALTSGTCTISRQSFTIGQTDVPGEPEYYIRFVGSSATGSPDGYAGIYTRIEDVRTFAGQTCTISFYAKASTAMDIAVGLAQIFGSGGSSTVYMNDNSNINLTTSWAKYFITINVDNISGKTLGTDHCLYCGIYPMIRGTTATTHIFTDTGDLNSETVEIALIQIELGSTASIFEKIPYSLNLSMCYRYLQRLNSSNFGRIPGQCLTTTLATFGYNLLTPMYKTPTVTDGLSSSSSILDSTGNLRARSSTNAMSATGPNGLFMNIVVGSTYFTAGQAAFFVFGGTDYIDVVAEIV